MSKMKRRRVRWLAWLLVLFPGLGGGAIRGASPPGARIVVNDRALPSNVPTREVAGTVLVPLRFVAEALGATVRWDPSRQVVTVAGEGRTVTARIGDPVLRSGERTVTAAVPPRVVDGRVMVPLRAVGIALGASVAWDTRARTIVIRSTGPAGRPSAGRPPKDQPMKPVSEAPLQVTLRTDKKEYRAGDPVRLTLEARNTSTTPITLHMSSGQKYDFEVRRGDTLIWKWSDDRMFTQALVDVPVGPRESLLYEETWPQRDRQGRPVEPGEYTVTGYLTVRDLNLPRPSVTIRILPGRE